MSTGSVIFQEPEAIITEGGKRAQWCHVALDQVRDLFPGVRFSVHCETPSCVIKRLQATMFHAVFYDDHVDTWVSCWDCYQEMKRLSA